MVFNYISESVEKIEEFTSKFTLPDDIAGLTALRTHAFKIQAFGRVIKRSVKKSETQNADIRKMGKVFQASGKYIEDLFGEYLYHFEMKELVTDRSLIEKRKQTLLMSCADINNHVHLIRDGFDHFQKENIQKFYLRGLIREIKKIHDDISIIDSNLLEDGTHELRRKLRWIIMYVIYPKGLFCYQEGHHGTSTFTQLTVIPEIESYVIPFESIEFLSASVYKLGQLKDKGLKSNYLKSHDQLNSSTSEITTETQKIMDELKKNNYLKKIRTTLKSQK